MVLDANLLPEHAVTARTESAFDRWVFVSPWRAAVVFALFYLAFQPPSYALFHILNDEPWVVTTRGDWLEFCALAVAMGAVGGVAFHVSRNLAPRSWTRAWIEAGNAGLFVSCAVAWDPVAWPQLVRLDCDRDLQRDRERHLPREHRSIHREFDRRFVVANASAMTARTGWTPESCSSTYQGQLLPQCSR